MHSDYARTNKKVIANEKGKEDKAIDIGTFPYSLAITIFASARASSSVI